MPAFPFEYEHAKVEGVRFHWLAQPVAHRRAQGHAPAVEFVRMQLGDARFQGRRSRADPGIEYAWPATW